MTLLADGPPGTAAGSSRLDSALDECEYPAGSGPCLHGARTGDAAT